MDSYVPLLEAFDYLDIVLGVFGAVIVSMWFGRGKSAWPILSGAAMGGLVKPVFFLIIGAGLLTAAQTPTDTPKSKAESDKIIDFWIGKHR